MAGVSDQELVNKEKPLDKIKGLLYVGGLHSLRTDQALVFQNSEQLLTMKLAPSRIRNE